MRTIDVHKFLDDRKVSHVHIAILASTMLLMFIDGFDVFMLGRIAPAIARAYGEAPANMAKVFVAQQTGLSIGAFFMSLATDKFGRKRIMMVSCFMFGLLTLSALLTTSLAQLAFTRFLDGLFLGGIVLTSSALTIEIAPKRWRATMLSLLYVGYSLGNSVGALVPLLVAKHGWQIGFWIGGLAPFVVGILFIAVVPESPRYLVGRNPKDPRLAKFMTRLDPGLDLSAQYEFVAGPEAKAATGKTGPILLFANQRWRMTGLLWMTTFISMGTIAVNGAWQVTYFEQLGGISMESFARMSPVMFAGMFLGTLTIGPLTDRFGPTTVISIASIGLALGMAATGNIPFGTVAFAIALFVQGYCTSGGQAAINALIGQSYPTAVRGVGFGWAGTVGRISGIMTPLIASYALVAHLPLGVALALVAAPSVLVAVIMQFLARVRRQLNVEEGMG
jgi:AAHS family 4-hydroxybenzoate transporter-like MFS transporter